MKVRLTISTLLATSIFAFSQTTFDQISAGQGYGQSGYFYLNNGSSQQVAYNAWDIAFSNLNVQSAGIFINESTNSSGGQTGPALEVYDALTDNFNDIIDPALFTERLYNPETNWGEGAFNMPRDLGNPFDFGWGLYNPGQFKVVGNRVFVIKLRNGDHKKIIFDEYTGTSYKFRVANPDNSDLAEHTINTNFGNGSPLIYFSLGANGANVTTPLNWDLVFCRYVDPLDDGQGNTLQYNVTGILSGDGVQVARAAGVDPNTVDYLDYVDSFSTELDRVGHDWKSFNLQQGGWITTPNLAYFVKTKQNKLYKIVFIDFEGSSTGAGTMERTFLGQLSAAQDLPAGIDEVLVYPNPVAERMTLSFTSQAAGAANLRLLSPDGKMVWSGSIRLQNGLNVAEIELPGLHGGSYLLNVQTAAGQFSRQISVGK
ncbi:MAG: T9SS type A sorting domain-containing protein [Saprospiraceae bacterium]|nr:T9SS type A sorting domain-containing protein [Saprospiraceae bacterium]